MHHYINMIKTICALSISLNIKPFDSIEQTASVALMIFMNTVIVFSFTVKSIMSIITLIQNIHKKQKSQKQNEQYSI